MASTRAFNVLEQRSTNENAHIGKTPLAGKNENRAPFKVSALKDLTNSTSRPTFPSKQQQQDGPASKKPLLLQKSTPSTSSSSLLKKQQQQKQSTTEVPVVVSLPKKSAAPFEIYTPQDAEYDYGKRACLREDLLEQMIEFSGVSYARKIKPMKPFRVAPVQLPEFELNKRSGELPKKVKQETPIVAKELPLFSLPVVDIPDFDFLL